MIAARNSLRFWQGGSLVQLTLLSYQLWKSYATLKSGDASYIYNTHDLSFLKTFAKSNYSVVVVVVVVVEVEVVNV